MGDTLGMLWGVVLIVGLIKIYADNRGTKY